MSKWTGRTKGSLLGYRIIVWTLKIVNIHAAYLLLRVVSYYYFLFSSAPREALEDFYAKTLKLSRKESKPIIRRNFYELAQSLLDRIAFNVGKKDLYSYTKEGEDDILAMADQGQGLILISGHYGNWDIAGQLLRRFDRKINVLMYDNEHEKIKEYLSSQGVQSYEIITQKNDLAHLIKIYNALKNQEILCLHADRFLPGAPTFDLDFFDQKALFPVGPFQLVSKLKAPYAFVFANKVSKFKYHFTAEVPEVDRKDTQAIAQCFADALAAKVRKNPDHWFNYYNFFHHE
ncbi:lysophospholipid acyltransferase family protein [Reichenbachiella agarivorans]|uniref:Lysophospholipid acyltransferase family protein n=1 Tax=Reichenbachiella agarivorans TaxID=2979464 RepID=A0ABY6CM08_9BACT|nr:lysophospholipid acyltransferase family protein [Reichenbachiella agarivorans]UXP30764.1 lysophospholipid acyltransferase family protein [Reichenbachiella agarivorans]